MASNGESIYAIPGWVAGRQLTWLSEFFWEIASAIQHYWTIARAGDSVRLISYGFMVFAGLGVIIMETASGGEADRNRGYLA